MFTVSKDFAFSASHQLSGLPEEHQCARLHGHNYVVRVELTGPEVDRVGFVLDYGELAPIKDLIDTHLDHRHLNDVLGFNPTAENMARWLVGRVRAWVEVPEGVRVSVSVSETPKTWATFAEQLEGSAS